MFHLPDDIGVCHHQILRSSHAIIIGHYHTPISFSHSFLI
jgi:hypothetical protein